MRFVAVMCGPLVWCVTRCYSVRFVAVMCDFAVVYCAPWLDVPVVHSLVYLFNNLLVCSLVLSLLCPLNLVDLYIIDSFLFKLMIKSKNGYLNQ